MTELDLMEGVSDNALIIASDTVRDVGMDTLNASLGKLAEDTLIPKDARYSLELSREDCESIFGSLKQLAKAEMTSGNRHCVSLNMSGHKIKYWVEAQLLKVPSKEPTAGDKEPLCKNQMIRAKITITHANGRQTEMVVKLSRDRNGYYWLGIQANPTSLLNRYNAFAVALPGRGRHSERRLFQKIAFAVLRRIVRSVRPNFEWHEETQKRIKDLAFRICPAQVFTFLPTYPRTPEQVMGYLRCCYGTPYKAGHLGYRLLCDDLGIEVQTRGVPGSLQTVLFLFRKSGRIAWSVSFYDKLAKAKSDAEAIKAEVGDADVIAFLMSAVRIDVTIHADGQSEMYHEAGFGTRENSSITAAEYCEAIRAMDEGRGLSGKKFVRWMLDFIFEEKLKFWALIRYSPKKLEKAREKLEAYNKEAAEGFAEWRLKGFEHIPSEDIDSVSFVQFMEKHAQAAVTRDVARRSRQKIMDMGLDPDIPLRAYDAFYNQTYVWDLEDRERHRLAEALESGDDATVARLQRRSRQRSVEVIKEIRSTFGSMIEAAHAPANTLGVEYLATAK